MILLFIYFPFYETLDGLRPCASFSTLEIFLIFITFLILEVTYHVSKSLLTQSKKTSKNYSSVTPTETIFDNKNLFLVESVHVYRCRRQVNVQCFSVRVAGLFALSVNKNKIIGSVALIPGAVDSVLTGVNYVFPVRISVRSTMSVLK